MQTTDTMPTDRNWAPIIQAEFDATSFTITGLPEHLGRDQAMKLLTDLQWEIQKSTPASPEAWGVVTVALDAINEKRGTSHTPESVAASLGIDLESATKADTSRIAEHIGGVLMR